MLRAAIVEKSKEHREYIRASLTGINMDVQVSEYADLILAGAYGLWCHFLTDNIWTILMRMRLLLISCC